MARAPRRERGFALLALAALLVLGSTWVALSALTSAATKPARTAHNARALAEAKAALIAWVATNALEPTEANPGRLPCPQAWGDVGSPNEGRAAAVCANPIGWLPWRTLGLPPMRDAAGRSLWYVVSPGWHLPNSTASLAINSDTPAQLTLDGRAAIALVVAAGAALDATPNAAQQATGCLRRTQSPALSIPPNPRDYLECYSGTAFHSNVIDNGANPVSNDQVVAITAGDLLPALEGAIAKRIERDIVPALRSVYAAATWGLDATNPVFPFAAPFTNPGSSTFAGVAATFQGLLPFNEIAGCSGTRCLPGFVAYAAPPSDATEVLGFGEIVSLSCAWESADVRRCEGQYREADEPWRPIRVEMSATFTNVAMGLRALDATRLEVAARNDAVIGAWQTQPVTYAATMNDGSAPGRPAGSVTITFGATLPNIDAMGWGSTAQFRMRIDRAVVTDHVLLDANAPSTGWFVRNHWYRLVYYAIAPEHAASAPAPRACGTCLHVGNVAPAGKQRAILVLAGRSLSGAPRPNAALADFLEGTNADGDLVFESRAVNATFNDRVVVVDASL